MACWVVLKSIILIATYRYIIDKDSDEGIILILKRICNFKKIMKIKKLLLLLWWRQLFTEGFSIKVSLTLKKLPLKVYFRDK